ncbi:MAG: hypothetical protein JWN96_437 [Mycobacterium sp.]|nr:hypothetical protein [Mycobacterium sp.]
MGHLGRVVRQNLRIDVCRPWGCVDVRAVKVEDLPGDAALLPAEAAPAPHRHVRQFTALLLDETIN